MKFTIFDGLQNRQKKSCQADSLAEIFYENVKLIYEARNTEARNYKKWELRIITTN